MKTTILLADDHALYREGVRELMGKWDDFEVIGAVQNGLEAVEFCRDAKPDIALLDVKMPIMDGVAACGAIHREEPGIAAKRLSKAVLLRSLRCSTIMAGSWSATILL